MPSVVFRKITGGSFMTSLTQEIISKKLEECGNDTAVLMRQAAELIRHGMEEILESYNDIHKDQYRLLIQDEGRNINLIAISSQSTEITRGGVLKLSTGKRRSNAVAVMVQNYRAGKNSFSLYWRYPEVGVTFWPNRNFPNTYWETNIKKPNLSCLQSFSASHGRFVAPEWPVDAHQVGYVLEKFTKLLPWDALQVNHAKKLVTYKPVTA